MTKATVQIIRDLGSIPSPQNAFMFNVEIEMLRLRVPCHSRKCVKDGSVSERSSESVLDRYCGLSEDKFHLLAQSVVHPASHTHRQMTNEQLIAAGIQPDLIRFSFGIEDIDDLIADMEQALNKSREKLSFKNKIC